MPGSNQRLARAKRLVRSYIKAKKDHNKRLQRRKGQLRHIFKHINLAVGPTALVTSSLNSLSDISDDSSSSSDSTGSFDEWDDLFGKGWCGNHFLSTNTSNSGNPIDLELEESLPDLEDVGSDSENDKDFSVEEDGDFDSDMFDVDADNEMSDAALSDLYDADEAEAGNIFTGDKWSHLRKWVRTQLVTMYANQYEIPWDGLPQGPSYLHHFS